MTRLAAAPQLLDYRATFGTPASTVTGDLRVLSGLARDVLVWLPPGALTSGRRYRVLYMFDGQNVFDAATSFSGEWSADETLTDLAGEGLELIAVAMPNAGPGRFREYTPYRGPGGVWDFGGGGRDHLRWMVDVVKPAVDALAPTDTAREATGILGSSLGGLMTATAAAEHGDVFSRFGIFSPAIPGGQGFILRGLRTARPVPERAYVDIGLLEALEVAADPARRRWMRTYPRDAFRVRDALLRAGLREPETLRLVLDPDGIHHESSWRRRLPDALRFLFDADAR